MTAPTTTQNVADIQDVLGNVISFMEGNLKSDYYY